MEPIKQEIFDEWIKGRACKSCAIFSKETFCFMLEPGDDRKDKRNCYFVHRLNEENNDEMPQDFGVKFEYDTQFKLAANPEKPELIISALGKNIFYHVGSRGSNEKRLQEEDIRVCCSVKYIGLHFYVTGYKRAVLRREGVDNWANLTRKLQENSPDDTSAIGFEDIDGFDESDIYAVGGEGDVWHYNGKEWFQVDIPTNGYLTSVCCASDGYVYIGSAFHMVIRGRRDKWEIINKDNINKGRFKQIVDYEGRLLAVDEWGRRIYEITSDGVIEMDTGGFFLPAISCLCLAVNHGMLLVAGIEFAAVFDGNEWHKLFSAGMGVSDEELLQMMTNETGQALDTLREALEDFDFDPEG